MVEDGEANAASMKYSILGILQITVWIFDEVKECIVRAEILVVVDR